MSKNILYLECYEGITGEMVLGALRDLAEALETEEKAPYYLPAMKGIVRKPDFQRKE